MCMYQYCTQFYDLSVNYERSSLSQMEPRVMVVLEMAKYGKHNISKNCILRQKCLMKKNIE